MTDVASSALVVAEKSQGLWERGWQSGTAGVLLAVWLLTLLLLLRSQHLRVQDKDKQQDRLEALTREVAAIVTENAKAMALLQKAIEERRKRTPP